ncbi:MAG: hypothetical protein ABSB35_06650 [Bryobacteraceae bacterium]|jgi:hypothetical protein
MTLARIGIVCFAVATVPAAVAQKWEFGGGVGGGFYKSEAVTSPDGSANASIQTGLAGSAWLGNTGQGHLGGEVRFDYQLGDLALSSGGSQATFGAHTYAVHYDFLWYATPRNSKIRPFVAVGAGIKVYQGTGTQVVYQPLSNVALLTKAQDLTPLVSVGGGVKAQLSQHVLLRLELHDFLTPFPNQVIAPNQGAKTGGWLQDFVPMAGISFLFGNGE